MNTSRCDILSLQELELHFSLDHNIICYFTEKYLNFIFCGGKRGKIELFFFGDGFEANIKASPAISTKQ